MTYTFRIVAIATAFLCMGLGWLSGGPAAKLDQYWAVMNNSSAVVVDHQRWQQILNNYLVEDTSGINLVDYEGVQKNAGELQQYIADTSAIDPRKLNRREQMSFWINLYNALTVQLVARSYPIESIKDLGNSLFASGPWDDEIVLVAGRNLSLNDIEHRILRPIFKDYRIHFAVNCASIGCPNLASVAYTSDNLDMLLQQGAKSYLSHQRGVNLMENELRLSSLFKWYQDDFGRSEQDMLKTLSKYLNTDQQEEIKNFRGQIKYDYDWFLNDLG